MLQYFEKKFVLGYQENEQRTRYATLSSMIGIVSNLVLSLLKIFCGILFSSIAVLGDGINNLSDSGTSIITLVGFRLSAKPADKKHPFGHARVEYISGFLVSFVILFVGFQLFLTSYDKIRNPVEIVSSGLTTLILLGSIFVKYWLYRVQEKIGTTIRSTAILGVAKDSFSDIFITLGVLISSLIYARFDLNLDGYIGIFISILVAKTGYDLAKDTLSPIIGEAPDPEFIKGIYSEIMSREKVLGVHDLVVHHYGENRYFASVHVEFDANITFVACHEIADQLERDFEDKGIQIVVHTDPVVTDSAEFEYYKNTVKSVLEGIYPTLNMHGFRYIQSGKEIKLLFDVVRTCELEKTSQELMVEISEKLRTMNKNFVCIIRVDEHYNSF
ncbi:MAG: cation diffusion facilitator family transporter [Eubacteriales bacterium]